MCHILNIQLNQNIQVIMASSNVNLSHVNVELSHVNVELFFQVHMVYDTQVWYG